ncbi:Eukaryotic translation initiation factor-related, putative isoform 2 [Hibiscus syriacus]|uniref:Eukaryotic translation initiation factor-related, putative isoform 2 n=1 Tax=Hibiscus syriacus TaxID=106335 RepID=A0A6A2X5T7_HIBSY|nr:Eukaryotic translation initiation factor-related, putative isoform 2 [Hibiscus syriacus]
MSKKKAFNGSTMTLKDFHGGSNPSDLPLPSAPGVTVRPADRSGSDRATSWGNPVGRPDNRARPNSSPATRHFYDKTPFFSSSVHIGRYFEEEERKSLDGVSAPRRVLGQYLSAPVVPMLSGSGNLYSSRVSGGNHRQAASGLYPNAWAARKVGTVSVARAEQTAVSKLVHVSAIDKVSSGQWQSKQSVLYQKDVDVSKHSETENGLHPQGYDDKTHSRMNAVAGREYSDAMLASQVERGLKIEDGIQGGRKALPDYETTVFLTIWKLQKKKPVTYCEGTQSIREDGRVSSSKSQPSLSVPSEASDRPKLKLLPRTKPLDNLEAPVVDSKQEQQWSNDSAVGHAGIEGNQIVERPKLNLKPRSQPTEQLEGNIEKERNVLFGGARPRELVLKERGFDDSIHELGQQPDRVKHNVPRSEKVAEQAAPRQGERVENLPVDQRAGRKSERSYGIHNERVDMQRNWPNENRQNDRETERQQQQQQERQSSFETWRKPAEKPQLVSPEAAGVHYGKAASALELAQAFSKPFSDQETDDQHVGQKVLPGHAPLPFSRLMGPTPRRQINGY